MDVAAPIPVDYVNCNRFEHPINKDRIASIYAINYLSKFPSINVRQLKFAIGHNNSLIVIPCNPIQVLQINVHRPSGTYAYQSCQL
jgi:hypothetical protein